MSPNIKIMRLIGGMMLIVLPVSLEAQETDREQVLVNDITRLGERAVRDRVISEDERLDINKFVRDSLPEERNLKIRALEQIRNELDEQYAEMVRQAQELIDESGYIGDQMLPEKLCEPEGYESPQEKRKAREIAAVVTAGSNMKEILKYVRPLPMKPWLLATLRMLFGNGVSQRPQRWDYTVVPQMGRVYDIIIPGGQPDDSWRDAPKMYYDPHPDKHFRR